MNVFSGGGEVSLRSFSFDRNCLPKLPGAKEAGEPFDPACVLQAEEN